VYTLFKFIGGLNKKVLEEITR